MRAITSIRNRWAHLGTQAYSREQILTDLYNLRDFFKIINIEADAKTAIRELIRNVTSDASIEDNITAEVTPRAVTSQAKSNTIEQNSIVRLKADHSKTGVVMQIMPVGDKSIKYYGANENLSTK